jgi:hypothetical protein
MHRRRWLTKIGHVERRSVGHPLLSKNHLQRRRRRAMFEVMARLKVRDGELEGFKRQAGEMMRLTRDKDTKTLRYDWFLKDDGSECEVRRFSLLQGLEVEIDAREEVPA